MNTVSQPLSFLSPQEVVHLARQQPTPFFVYDVQTMRQRYADCANLPNAFGLTVRYSVKANPNRTILALFDELGARFDVSSVWEARRALHAGIDPARILMTAQEASNGWEELCRRGVEFDAGSLRQLDDYGRAFPGTEVSVRINPGFGSGLVKKLTSGGAHSSFGIWHEHLPEVCERVRAHRLTLRRLHLHIGSGHEGAVLERTVDAALGFCESLPSVTILNLGGGYRIAAFTTDARPDHAAMGARIAAALEAFAARTGRRLHLEIEPGTYLMAMSGSLVTRVIDTADTGADGHRFLKIDAGLTELVRPSYYGAPHPMVTVRADGSLPADAMRAIVTGHCCIAGDNLTPVPGNTEDFAPVTLGQADAGDFLVIERAGGYAASMCLKNFNSYPEAAEIMRIGPGQFLAIRGRQTLEHMVHNEVAVALAELVPPGPSGLDGDIEGEHDVQLAPVQGPDERRTLPREFFLRAPMRFLLKFTAACALVALGIAAFAMNAPLPLQVAAFVLNGLMFAHLVELQHECLHGHAFRSPRFNRLFGVACGLFMLSSHSHYRHDHLRHHAFLGTARNREHFHYRFQHLDSVAGFARAFFDLNRYARIGDVLRRAVLGLPLPGIDTARDQQAIKQEYLLYALVVAAAVVWSVWAGSWVLLWAWALPTLLIAEGVHFMIEMPEHFGLDTQSNANVLSNTRTIRTSALVSWFVNGNDLHTAHHFHQGVPMCNVQRVHTLIHDRIGIVERSYLHFYRQVVAGRIKQHPYQTCMVR